MHYFFTGVPGFIGNRLAKRLMGVYPEAHFHFLVEPVRKPLMDAYLKDLEGDYPDARQRAHFVEGDITRPGLGLTAAARGELAGKVTDAFHLAAVYDLTISWDIAERVNVVGTRNVLEFLKECRGLRRHNYISTAYVSGMRTGRILETELAEGQGFKNHYEATKYYAEVEVQKTLDEIPTVIYRPGIVVGDSQTGETGKYDGPYYGFVALNRGVFRFYAGSCAASMNVVPVNFIFDAITALSQHEKAAGKVFHLCDPAPISARNLMDEAAQLLAVKPPGVTFPLKLVETALKVPALRRYIRIPPEVLPYLNHPADYDTTNTQALLNPLGIKCPPIRSYLPRLMEFLKSHPRL